MDFSGLGKLKDDLLKGHSSMMKQIDALTNSKFQENLSDLMAQANALSGESKRVKVSGEPAEMVLTKTGDILLKFDKKEAAKKFFSKAK